MDCISMCAWMVCCESTLAWLCVSVCEHAHVGMSVCVCVRGGMSSIPACVSRDRMALITLVGDVI